MISIIIPGDICANIDPGSWLWILSGCGLGFSLVPQIAFLMLFVTAIASRGVRHAAKHR